MYLTELGYKLGGVGRNEAGTEDWSVKAQTPGKAHASTVVRPSLNPAIRPDLQAIDGIVGDLFDFFNRTSVQFVLLSEYGITHLNCPIHLNQPFRDDGR